MQEYEDITGLFDLTESDLASRKTLMSKREEVLLRFDLAQEVTIEVKGKEFDRNAVIQLFENFSENIENYQLIHQVEGLNHFLATGDFNRLDFNALSSLPEEFKSWIKPFFNNAYYNSALVYIDSVSDLDAVEYRSTEKKLAQLKKAISGSYLEEGKQKIDDKWRNALLFYKERYLNVTPKSKGKFLSGYSELKRITGLRSGRLLTIYTYPYNRGRVAFDSFLTAMINFSIDAVRGNMSRYKTSVVRYLLGIAKHLENESAIRMNGYKAIRENLEELSHRRDYSVFRNVVILFAILFCGGTVLKNSGCGPKRPPTPRVKIIKQKYDLATNTLDVEFRRQVYGNNNLTGDGLIEFGMKIFEKHFPDTSSFNFIGRGESHNVEFAIERRIVRDTAGYRVLPTIEDSIFLSQPFEFNFAFDSNEGLKMSYNYIVDDPKKGVNTNTSGAISIDMRVANFVVRDRDSLLIPGYYSDEGKKGNKGKIGMLNDFFLLKNRTFKIDEPLVIPIPKNQATHFFQKQDSIVVQLENGLDRSSFLAVAKTGRDKHIIYKVDRDSKKILGISMSRMKSWMNVTRNALKRVDLNDPAYQLPKTN